MFDGGVPEQFHQFIAAAASRTTPSSTSPSPSLPLPLPLYHHHGGGGFDPFLTHHNNPAATHHHHHFTPPPTQPPHPPHPPHPLYHQLHHKDDDSRREDDEREKRVVAGEAMSEQSAGDRPWSNDEVIALLRVRSSMEGWFPPEITWEQVSRKFAEMGFKRTPEKCKEKFEEQSMRSVFGHNNNNVATNNNLNFSKNNYRLLVGDELDVDLYAPPQTATHNPPQFDLDRHEKNIVDKPMEELPQQEDQVKEHEHEDEDEQEQDNIDVGLNEDSRTEDNVTVVVKKRKVRKNKRFEMFKSFCLSVVDKLMTQQEEMHKKLLEDMFRRDKEMVEREEAWKKMHIERVTKDLDSRAKEQSVIGTRSAAIIEFLKKFTDSDGNILKTFPKTHQEQLDKPVETATETLTVAKEQTQPNNAQTSETPRNQTVAKTESDTGKRWPREEVLALINLRCSINGGTNEESQIPNKVPLWERISQGMSELGYSRSSKRCKEKWENINKYFRKTKDINANKKRSVESRTCPYFDQLSALYNQGKLVLAAENRPNSPESDQAAASGGGGGSGE